MDELDSPVSGIVKNNYRAAEVFKKYQLSFCCAGNMSLKSACEAKGIDSAALMAELRDSARNLIVSNNLQFGEWKIDFLVDLISNIHHNYIYQQIPPLAGSLESFTIGHGEKYPELTVVTELFTKLTGLLTIHNRHEDEIIFPYIKQIDAAYRRKEPYGNLFVRTLRKPLHQMEQEHRQILKLLNALKMVTNEFTVPENACLNYFVHYKKLEEAYHNLLQHKFLEDTHLFPKAIAIEQKLLQF